MFKKFLVATVASLALVATQAQSAGAYYTVAFVTSEPSGLDPLSGDVLVRNTISYYGKYSTYSACVTALNSIVKRAPNIRKGTFDEWYNLTFDVGTTSAFCITP